MNNATIELVYIILIPLFSVIGIVLNIISSIIFNKKEFKNNKFFKLLSIISIIDAIILFLLVFLPITQYCNICNLINNNCLLLSYLFRIYEHYVVICLIKFLKTLRSLLTISISFYRLFSLKNCLKLIDNFNFIIYFCLLVFISSITTIPIVFFKEISLQNSTYVLINSKLLLNNNYYLILFILTGPFISFLTLIIILSINIFICFYLKKLYNSQKSMRKLSTLVAMRLIKRYSLSYNGEQQNQSENKTIKYEQITNREIKITILVIVLSILACIDRLLIFVSYYLFYLFGLNSHNFKFFLLIIHFLWIITHILNIFVHYCFNDNFSIIFKSFFHINCLNL